MSGAINPARNPARSFEDELDRVANPKNTLNVDLGTGGPAIGYERVVDGKRTGEDRVGVGGEVGVNYGGRPRGALYATQYISMVRSPVTRALFAPELTGSLRYDHEHGRGGAVGGRLGMNTTVVGRANVGFYVGIDRGVTGDRKGSWGAEIGVSTGINF
jgi:hypothetical protein